MAVRPYFVTYKGVQRLVEASSPAVAAQHVVGPDIVELRPARASEVSAWYRANRPIDLAGEKGAELTAGVPVGGAFSATDALHWLLGKMGGEAKVADASSPEAAVVERFSAMRNVGTMDIHDFRVISERCPAFVDAIAGRDQLNAAPIVNELEGGETIDFQDVVTAIGQFIRDCASAENQRQAAQP